MPSPNGVRSIIIIIIIIIIIKCSFYWICTIIDIVRKLQRKVVKWWGWGNFWIMRHFCHPTVVADPIDPRRRCDTLTTKFSVNHNHQQKRAALWAPRPSWPGFSTSTSNCTHAPILTPVRCRWSTRAVPTNLPIPTCPMQGSDEFLLAPTLTRPQRRRNEWPLPKSALTLVL